MMWKIELPEQAKLRIVFASVLVMVFGNNVIRWWFAQFCNSFDIKSQRQTPKTLPIWVPEKDIPGPTPNPAPPAVSNWRAPELHLWAWATTGAGCISLGPVSSTLSELTKPEAPSAPTWTSYALPGIRPFNPKLWEPFTIFFLHSTLQNGNFAKTTSLNILRDKKSLVASREANSL